MTWFRLDDNSAFHRKVVAAGNEAWGACCRAGAWSADHLADGRIPWAIALTIAPRRVWDRLLKTGLCEGADLDGFVIHDYLDRNPSRDEVLSIRQHRAKAGSNGGKQRASNCLALASDVAQAKRNPDPDPDPDPRSDPPVGPPLRPKGKRGARIGPEWLPAAGSMAKTLGELGISDAEHDRELDKFRDHFLAASGAKAVRAEWEPSFRNWLRRSAEEGKIGGHFPKKTEREPEAKPPAAEPWIALFEAK